MGLLPDDGSGGGGGGFGFGSASPMMAASSIMRGI
jgi:hypothetical protein